MTRILIAFIAFYKRWLSPAIHTLGVGGCRFQPTCSEYAMRAIAMHGPLRGLALAVWRLLRCHPFSRGGLDQVPPVKVPVVKGVSPQVGISFEEESSENFPVPSHERADAHAAQGPQPGAFAQKPLP
jgi:putative membrane protein insertion efficiency factor